MDQEGMFSEFVLEDVVGVPAELSIADYGCPWRFRKGKMEKATGGTWTEFDWSPRPLQFREYAPREFWEHFRE